MSTKRRDNKGRVLLNREIQEESGRYRYRYIDILGKRRELYSWRLTEADPTPAGRRRDKSLREKEEAAMLLQFKGISGSDMTVLDLVERYITLKTGVKKSTQQGYQTVISNLKKEPFALRRIDSIKISDAKLFLIHLQREKGMSYSSIHNIRGVLRPAFQLAVDDDLIMKNPFGFEMGTVIQNDSKKREAITTEEKENFLAFVRADNHYKQYYDAFCLLFATGLRISEFCGLTTRDLDFKNKVIHVNKQLVRHSDMEYYIETTKTSSGKRDFPMDDEIEAICKRIIQNRRKPKVEKVIKGASGFLFYDKNDMPRVALHWEKYFEYAVNKYNRTHKVLMPKITPHVCRHTFCSEKAKEGMNPKALQYLMGHSDIAVTLNVYPGCPALVTGRYCEEHARKANSDYEKFSRDKNTKRRYGRAWKRIRDKYAAEHPFCEKCYEHGVLVPVEEIHHKLPLSEGGTHDRSNLIALCKSCHSQIHAKRGDRWHDR